MGPDASSAPFSSAPFGDRLRHGAPLPMLVVFAVAIVGRLPAFGAWWAGADWERLAAGAGLENAVAGWPVERLFWLLAWPVAGLNADAHTLLRLGLHGLAAVLVVRIAARAGLGQRRRTLAGLVWAVAPLGFLPLYQGMGVARVLGAVLALAAVDRWLAGTTRGRVALLWASLLAVLAAGCGPDALGLPVFLLACAWAGLGVRPADKAFAWALLLIQLLLAVAMAALAIGGGDPPAFAGLLTALTRLGACGWWLVSPAPMPVATVTAAMASAGGLLLVGWAVWAAAGLRLGLRWPLLTLVAASLALAPAVLGPEPPTAAACYLALAPFGLLLGAVIPAARLRGRDVLGTAPLLGLLALAAAAAGFFSMEARLGAREPDGRIADPAARATALSWQGCRTIGNLQSRLDQLDPAGRGLSHLVLLQPVLDADSADTAARLGERWARPTEFHRALGGPLGPRLLLGPGTDVTWMNGLTTAPSGAIVLCATPTGFRLWGPTPNALLYAALTDVGAGRFARARGHLKRAAELGGEQITFFCDEGQMVVPLARVLDNRHAFIDWTVGLLNEGQSRREVGGLQDMFHLLLSRATGRSLADLTAGSHLVGPPATSPDTPAKGSRP